MSTIITVIHVITCVFLVLVVLLQSGKGAEISASLAGSSQTVFGSSGGTHFFAKVTYVLAAIFMVTSVSLTILGSRSRTSVFDGAAVPVAATAPVSAAATSSPSPAASGK